MMDDGELDFSNQEVMSNSSMGEIDCYFSIDSLLEELMKDVHACTHTHTCNLPGLDKGQTHTCLHVHTKIVPVPNPIEEKSTTEDTAKSEDMKSNGWLNRKAVRKYREKKNAIAAASLEEIIGLRAVNHQLAKKMKGHVGMEAEVARLKCLLVVIRGIDGEIRCFPYQKPVDPNVNDSVYVMNQCNVRCDDQPLSFYVGESPKKVWEMEWLYMGSLHAGWMIINVFRILM